MKEIENYIPVSSIIDIDQLESSNIYNVPLYLILFYGKEEWDHLEMSLDEFINLDEETKDKILTNSTHSSIYYSYSPCDKIYSYEDVATILYKDKVKQIDKTIYYDNFEYKNTKKIFKIVETKEDVKRIIQAIINIINNDLSYSNQFDVKEKVRSI